MKEYTSDTKPSLEPSDPDRLTTPEAAAVAPATETPAQIFVAPTGTWGRLRHLLRKAGMPRKRNPRLAAALQIIPGAGYIYMWRWGSAILTAFLSFVAYV